MRWPYMEATVEVQRAETENDISWQPLAFRHIRPNTAGLSVFASYGHFGTFQRGLNRKMKLCCLTSVFGSS